MDGWLDGWMDGSIDESMKSPEREAYITYATVINDVSYCM